MSRLFKIPALVIILLSLGTECFSFQNAVIRGTVRDSTGSPIDKAAVIIPSLNTGTYSGADGRYSISVPGNEKEIVLTFSCVGYRSESRTILPETGETILDIILKEETGILGEVMVSGEKARRDITLTRIPVRELRMIPAAAGSVEALIKTFPGVSSNNELSSQYSVRGGNYDENLVYVNGIEIFKPFLVRSGQQEGLSFINPDLVSSVSFSSGGFGAAYGDKMSSVLDITYRTPSENGGSVSLGLLTSTAHAEGLSRSGRFSWLAGARYRSTRLLLNTLDSEGDYQPVFYDIQSIFRFRTGTNSSLSLLTTFSSNIYNFRPQSRSSTFGSEAEAYQLYVLFQGSEKDRYQTMNSILTWEMEERNKNSHKFTLSSFVTGEREAFDIRGFYNMSTLDKTSGSENFSDTLMNIGLGSFLSHARNRLYAFIQSAGYRGSGRTGNIIFEWGFRLRHDRINDRIKEWTLTDSAGFSIPYGSENLELSSLVSETGNISRLLAESFFDMSGTLKKGKNEYIVYGGIRSTYDSFSDELLISPRISLRVRTGARLSFRLAGGVYYQPPFYKEMRYPDGSLNNMIRSQRSVHMLAGSTWDFQAWGRPFRLSSEIYNKFLTDIIPYRIDNVRLVYSGENTAEGYSRGIDLRLNGEFVPGAESWISLSLMDSRLRIPGVLDDYFPAPFDQVFSANIFFQDYLPGNPTWRAHINISFATGLPIVSPFNNRYDQYHRLPDYRRVDLGITKIIKGKNKDNNRSGFLNRAGEIIAGLEVFNLLDINNTVSYYWVRTINNLTGRSRQFAVPNYLTGRSLNIRIMASF